MSEQQSWAVSPKEAAKLLGIDRSTFYRQVMPHVYSGTVITNNVYIHLFQDEINEAAATVEGLLQTGT